jgi:DUF971 family protein
MDDERTRLVGATLDPEAGMLTLRWGDGHESPMPLPYLRSKCPCASCRHYREQAASGGLGLSVLPPQIANASSVIQDIQAVGRYGMQPVWQDGHSTGIYTFDYLREICPCEECRRA